MDPVAVGAGALNRAGLIVWYAGVEQITTSLKSLDRAHICTATMEFIPELENDTRYIRITVDTPYGKIRVPTEERAICDNIRFENRFDMGLVCDAIEEYHRLHGSFSKLRAVAKEYGVLDRLEYWISECDI